MVVFRIADEPLMTDEKPQLTRRRVLSGVATIGAANAVGLGTWARSQDTERERVVVQAGGPLGNGDGNGNGNGNSNAEGELNLVVGEQEGVIEVDAGTLNPGDAYRDCKTLSNAGDVPGGTVSVGIPGDSVESTEGENYDEETDTKGEGELDDYLDFRAYLAAEADAEAGSALAFFVGSENEYVSFNDVVSNGRVTIDLSEENLDPIQGKRTYEFCFEVAYRPDGERGAAGDTLQFDIEITLQQGTGQNDRDGRVAYVSNNGPNNAGDVDAFDARDFDPQFATYQVGNNEGVDFNTSGDLFQAGDGDQTSIRVFVNIADREDGADFDPNRDREIIGGNTNLGAPKGIDVESGFVFVADNGAGNVKVFRAGAEGNVSPVATTPLDVPPWDVDYDGRSDRLFVSLTNGTVAVFEGYFDGDTGSGDPRIITPVDGSGNKISTNLHGIVLASSDSDDRDRNGRDRDDRNRDNRDGRNRSDRNRDDRDDRNRDDDTLVVTDVGDAAVANDGSIYVIENASTASGNVRPARTIRGDGTQLGNPVDVFLNGEDALIAEKANDLLLIFWDVFSDEGGNVSPDVSVAETKPESITIDLMNDRGRDRDDRR